MDIPQLNPVIAASTIAREIVGETGSTSDVLKRRAEAGEAHEVALLAHRQTGGRGRHGRLWRTIAGNLHLSLLSAVALADMVRPLEPQGDRLRLKWPNGLLLDGAKRAGAPDDVDRPTASLAGLNAPDPATFARHLLASLDQWRQRDTSSGFAPIRDAWLAEAAPPGTQVTVSQGSQRVTGTLVGLAPNLSQHGVERPLIRRASRRRLRRASSKRTRQDRRQSGCIWRLT